MNDRIKEILSIERQLAALDETKSEFETHPANLTFFEAQYKKLASERAALKEAFSADEMVELESAVAKAREQPNVVSINGCVANIGPIAGVTRSGKRFAFIPTGPLYELKIGPDGKLIEKKLRD